jgi:hypothetical protein
MSRAHRRNTPSLLRAYGLLVMQIAAGWGCLHRWRAGRYLAARAA